MSPEQEQQIVDALTDPNLNWMRDAFDFAYRTISGVCNCPTADAEGILEQLLERKLIEAVSESGGTPAANRTLDSHGWKWVVTRR